jgi:hypothetical protein
MRRTSVIVAATAALVVAGPAVVATAATDGVTVKSLASCTAHYANTAAWMDCTGGSEKSQVRLGYNCGVGPVNADRHTNWFPLDPWGTRTVSADCNFRVNGAWPNVRKY